MPAEFFEIAAIIEKYSKKIINRSNKAVKDLHKRAHGKSDEKKRQIQIEINEIEEIARNNIYCRLNNLLYYFQRREWIRERFDKNTSYRHQRPLDSATWHQEILQDILAKGRNEILELLNEQAPALSAMSKTKLNQFYCRVFELIGETLFLGALLFRKDPRETKFDFYFWPGYSKVIAGGAIERFMIRGDFGESSGFGIAMERNDSNSSSQIKDYKSCAATFWFSHLLDSKHEHFGYKPGGTHHWIAGGPPIWMNSGRPMDTLTVQVKGTDYSTQDFDPIDNTHRIYSVPALEENDLYCAGPIISSYLNAGEFIRHKKCILDKGSSLLKHKAERARHNSPLNRLHDSKKKKKDDSFYFWPFVENQQELFKKDKLGAFLEINERLYSVWLIACFRPDMLNMSTIDQVFAIDEPTMRIIDKSTMLTEAFESIKQSIQRAILDYHSQEFLLAKGNHVFKLWYSLVMRPTVDVGRPLKPEATELGSAMFLSSAPINDQFFPQVRNWLGLIYRDMRYMEASIWVKRETKKRDREIASHELRGSFNTIKRIHEDLGVNCNEALSDEIKKVDFSIRLWDNMRFITLRDAKPINWEQCKRISAALALWRLVGRADPGRGGATKKVDTVLSDNENRHAIEAMREMIYNVNYDYKTFLNAIWPDCDNWKWPENIPAIWKDDVEEGIIINILMQSLFHAGIYYSIAKYIDIDNTPKCCKGQSKRGPFFCIDHKKAENKIIFINRALDLDAKERYLKNAADHMTINRFKKQCKNEPEEALIIEYPDSYPCGIDNCEKENASNWFCVSLSFKGIRRYK